MIKHELRISGDGSHTLFNNELGDTYHSIFGAVSESSHIFINLGLKSCPQKASLNILEIGLGTGLNLLLTARETEGCNYQIHYHGIEAYPLAMELALKLNYPSEGEIDLFRRIHELPWNSKQSLNESIQLFKDHVDLQDFEPIYQPYDLVYFDAFAPDLQPELWSEDVFGRIFQACSDESVLVTYSCKGSVKRALRSAGFRVEKHPGPAGKREVIRAVKSPGLHF